MRLRPCFARPPSRWPPAARTPATMPPAPMPRTPPRPRRAPANAGRAREQQQRRRASRCCAARRSPAPSPAGRWATISGRKIQVPGRETISAQPGPTPIDLFLDANRGRPVTVEVATVTRRNSRGWRDDRDPADHRRPQCRRHRRAWWQGLSAADRAAAQRRFEAGRAERRAMKRLPRSPLLFLLAAAPAAAQHGRLGGAPDRRRRHASRFPLPLGRDPAGAAHPLCDARHAAPRRGRRDRQCGDGAARHRRLRPPVPRAAIRRRAVRPRPAARHRPLLHHPARRYRPWPLVQAERRPADALPALRL